MAMSFPPKSDESDRSAAHPLASGQSSPEHGAPTRGSARKSDGPAVPASASTPAFTAEPASAPAAFEAGPGRCSEKEIELVNVGIGRMAWAFLRRDALIDASYRANWLFRVSALFFSLWSLFFLGRAFGASAPLLARFGGDYFAFALIGVAFTTMTSGALSGTARRVRELSLIGGLEALFAAPVPPFRLVLMLALHPTLLAVLQSGLFVLMGIALFGASFDDANFAAAALAAVLSLAAYLALGVLSASFVLVFKRSDPVAWLIGALTYLLSGVVYPVEVLPAALRPLSALLPATHAIDALRSALLLSADWGHLARPLLSLGLFCAVLWPLAAIALFFSLRHALSEGSLGHP